MITSLQINITNFDNAAMLDYPNGEVIRILEEVVLRIKANGLTSLPSTVRDSNGNTVGSIVTSED